MGCGASDNSQPIQPTNPSKLGEGQQNKNNAGQLKRNGSEQNLKSSKNVSPRKDD
jgi:hypothetical protein